MKHYLCNVGLSLLILGVWGTMLYRVTNNSAAKTQQQLVSDDSASKPSVKTYPGDERLGVLSREVHLDADKIKRKEVVRFRDSTFSTVYYDTFGRLLKVEEVNPSGDYLVFNFDPKKADTVKNLQVFRKDRTLAREMTPAGKKGMESTFYAEDGKTKICSQLIAKDNVSRATFYQPDGVTLKANYKVSRDLASAELRLYTDKGVLRSVQKISPASAGCNDDDECGNDWIDVAEVKYYREDGKTVWFELTQPGAAGAKNSGTAKLKEYLPDGKGLARVVNETVLAPEDWHVDAIGEDEEAFFRAESSSGYCVEVYDAAGKVAQKRYLKDDFAIVRDENLTPEGGISGTKEYIGVIEIDAEVQGMMNKSFQEDTNFLGTYLFPEQQPNHLEVTIAVTQLEL